MASSTRHRTEAGASATNLKSDNADDLRGKALQDLHLKGSKHIVQRTRDALGDIGNRLAKKNQVSLPGKPAGPMKSVQNFKTTSTTGLSTRNVGDNFAVPIARPPRATNRPDQAKKQLTRSNSVNIGAQGQILTKSKPELVKAKIFTNLQRAQCVQLHQTDGSFQLKNETRIEAASGESIPRAEGLSDDSKEYNKENTGRSPVIAEEIKKPQNKTDTDIVSSELITTTEAEKVFSQERYEITDIDAVDEKNAFLVKEYILDICDYLFELEKKYPIRIRYLEGRLVNSRMRAVLLDWLVEVHYQFGFMPETLYMACKVMDRFLQKDRKVSRKQLQLVGITSMYVAAKFEEVCTPTVLDFSAVSDNAYAAGEIRQMERDILHAIGFDLAPPQAVFFLRRFSKAAGASILVHTMAKYIMELTLVDYGTCHLFPSEQAASSLALSLMIMNNGKTLRELWTHTLEYYTRIPLELLKGFISPVASMLAKYCEEETPKLKAVRNKYARNRLSRISLAPELQIDQWKIRVLKDLC